MIMVPTRAALALSVLALLAALLPVGVSSARAQTVPEAEEKAEAARQEADDAYRVVSEAVEDRDSVELELFEALNRYEEAVRAVAAANGHLDTVAQALARAEAGAAGISEALRDQAVQAYVEAVTNPASMVVVSQSVETAMLMGQALGEDQFRQRESLNSLTAQQAELDRLRTDYQAERDAVEALEATLAEETAHLEEVFSRADEAVAAAYRQATEADSAYRQALSDVERARAAATTTTTAPPAPAAGPATTTTTTAAGAEPDGDETATTEPPAEDSPETATTTAAPAADGELPPVGPATERWRSLVASHFRSGLVEEALVVIQCESNGDPDAVNAYSGASGLFQFIPGTWAVASVSAGVGGTSVFDPEANVTAAAWLAGYYEANGRDPWAPWSCRNEL